MTRKPIEKMQRLELQREVVEYRANIRAIVPILKELKDMLSKGLLYIISNRKDILSKINIIYNTLLKE